MRARRRSCRWPDRRGFTLVEVTVASSLFLLLMSALLAVMLPVDGVLVTGSEHADIMQRLRAASDAVHRDLAAAGAGVVTGRSAGSLATVAPALWPARRGLRGADPPGTFRREVLTVLAAAPLPAMATTIAQPMAARNDVVSVNLGPGCPVGDALCGMRVDDDVLIGDREGGFDLFTVIGVMPPLMQLRHNGTDGAAVYPAGSLIVPVTVRTYMLRAATATRPPQLIRYDGGSGPEAAVADHVVHLAFDYFGEPEPPRMLRPLSDAIGPWTTYGPAPPADDTAVMPHTAGSNCIFSANGSPLATAVLPPLGAAATALVPLGPRELTDGPWCPDGAAPDRYDADLFRLRGVEVSLRVEAAAATLRGPAGVLFTRGGTARSRDRYVPDVELRWRLTPPNLAGLR